MASYLYSSYLGNGRAHSVSRRSRSRCGVGRSRSRVHSVAHMIPRSFSRMGMGARRRTRKRRATRKPAVMGGRAHIKKSIMSLMRKL